MNDANPHLLTLFAEALAADTPEARLAYLDRVCGDDRGLRARLESLLRAHHEAGRFLGDETSAHSPEIPLATPAHRDGPGTVLGPYKLLQEIGEGGMGTVFMAEQTQPVRRKVALKIIRPGMDSRQIIARFEAERQALALMDHPNIARVLDAGTTENGRPYFVMELVKGVPITKYCDERRLNPKQRLELFLPVCQAVQHAHQKGIIHRDLKPSNVLVTEYDEKPVVKVIDFGIAKATGPKLTDGTMFTELGQVVGTLEYMSPEQAKLNALDIDTRSDIYSLGVLLYELLTGTTPFEKRRLQRSAFDEILRMIREEEPPKPSTRLSATDELPSIAVNRGLEPKKLSRLMQGELDWIVMKALEKDRNRRYETANGFALDILRHLQHEPVLAGPPGATYRLRKFLRRNRGPAMAGAVVLLALVGGIVGTTWQALRAMEAEADALREGDDKARALKDALVQKAAAVKAQGAALSEADRNRRLLYSADVHLASQVWQGEEGAALQCNELLLAHIPGPGQPDRREFCWRYQWRLMGRDSIVRLPFMPRAAAVAVGDSVVAVDGTGQVASWRIGDRTARPGTPLADAAVLRITLARNGAVAAVIDRNGSARVLDIRTGRGQGSISAPSELVNIKLSADGRFLAGVGRDQHARVWEVASGKQLYDFLMIDASAGHIDLSADGKLLLASGGRQDSYVILYRAESPAPAFLNRQEGAFVRYQNALSPDGRLAAVGHAGNDVDLYDTASARCLASFNSRSTPFRVAFSPDGRQLAVGEKTGLITLWHVPRPPGLREAQQATPEERAQEAARPQVARLLKGHLAAVETLAFTPDGLKLVSIDRERVARCWNLGDQEESRAFQKRRSQINALNYSADGRYLVEAGEKVWLHDLKSGNPPRVLSTGTCWAAVFSPDGQTIAAGPDGPLSLWEAATGRLLCTLSEQPPTIGALAFSPDGRWLAAGMGHPTAFGGDSPRKVMLFDVKNRREHRTFPTPTQVTAVAFSPDGKFLAAAGHNGTVWLWDTAAWDEVARWQSPVNTAYASVLFLDDGRELAAGCLSGRIDVWDVNTGTLTRKIQGHTDGIPVMALSPDGRTLATGSWDRSIKLWDSGTGRELRTLHGHRSWLYTLAFSPDGNTLASGGVDGVVRLWEASSTAAVAADLSEMGISTKAPK